jgi:hypothetical protein
MTPFASLPLRAAALAGLALGLSAALPAQAEVYRCNENGQTTYSDHPCGARAKPVPLVDDTPSAADQKAARERASAEAAQLRQDQTARRKVQAEDDARQARIAIAAQAAEQARLEQQRRTAIAQDSIRYCHRVYVGPVPYPYPVPMPVVSPTPMPRIVSPQQANGGKLLAPSVPPAQIMPRPPHPHPPLYRIVCEPGYDYDGPEDLLPFQ